jgi:hypothetical protein
MKIATKIIERPDNNNGLVIGFVFKSGNIEFTYLEEKVIKMMYSDRCYTIDYRDIKIPRKVMQDYLILKKFGIVDDG